MDWPEARVALNRLVVDLKGDYWGRPVPSAKIVALAGFALTAQAFDFQGRKAITRRGFGSSYPM
jgi:hypothetical protein